MLFPSDPSDWLAFAMRIKWTLLSTLLCAATACVVANLGRFRGKRLIALLLTFAAFAFIFVTFRDLTGREMLVTLLGSEDDGIAEKAYRELRNQAPSIWLLARINDRNEESNVRFYLARMLATNSESVERQNEFIGRINSDRITPRFFAANAFNGEAAIIPAPFTTRDVALYFGSKTELRVSP